MEVLDLFGVLKLKDLRRIRRESFFVGNVVCERIVSAVGFAHGLYRSSMLTFDSYNLTRFKRSKESNNGVADAA